MSKISELTVLCAKTPAVLNPVSAITEKMDLSDNVFMALSINLQNYSQQKLGRAKVIKKNVICNGIWTLVFLFLPQ